MNNKLFCFIKAGQPRIWFSSTGQLLHWESPGTSRARELADVYRLLDCEEDLEGNDRMPALEALKNMVIDFVNLFFHEKQIPSVYDCNVIVSKRNKQG